MLMNDRLIEVKDLCKFFKVGKGNTLKAVDHVNLYINKGETLGLVGESGCGKTTCGRTILRLYDATSGQVFFDGKDVSKMRGKELLEFKKRAQIILSFELTIASQEKIICARYLQCVSFRTK